MPEPTKPPEQQNLLTDEPKADEKPVAAPPAEKPDETLLTGNEDKPEDKPKGTETPGTELQLKPPVGVNVDDPAFVKFKQFAEAKKLTQEQAQEALDMLAANAADALAKSKQAFAQAKAEWAKTAKADPEIGGDRLTSSLASAKRAIDKYGTKGLREALQSSGLGNHPEVVRFFARVGKSLGEDSFNPGSATPPTPKQTDEDMYRRMYPSMFPKEQ